MAEPNSERRAYSSVLRGEQQGLTRDRIMKAVADLIQEGRIHSFTIEEVAQRAGVSYGSVYRHFPSREGLLEELYGWLQQSAGMPAMPNSLDAIPAFIESLVALMEANADVGFASVMAMNGLGLAPRDQRKHDEVIVRLVAEADPGLDAQQVRVKAAAIRYLTSSLAWATLRQRLGLDAAETTSALKWALQTLIQEIKTARPARETALQSKEEKA